MGRAQRLVTNESDSIVRLVASLNPATLVLDIEPLVASWGSEVADVATRALSLSAAVADAAPSLSALIFATNAHMSLPKTLETGRLVVTFACSARKPWCMSYLRGKPRPFVVVGDQVVTDGLLAVRLRATFIHYQKDGHTPWWPRVQVAVGKMLAPFVFASDKTAVTKSTGTGR